MGRLDGRVGIVTGGASGIGRAVARVWAREGASVVVVDIDGEGAAAVAAELNASGHDALAATVDVADEPSVRSMVETAVDTFGRLDILHNNAGITAAEHLEQDGIVTEMSLQIWNRTIAVNLTGPMLGCKYAIPHMLAGGGGSIINTSSINAMSGDIRLTAYAASKAGIDGLTLRVATQFGRLGVRCNSVRPGFTLSEPVRLISTPELLESMRAKVLTPHLGTPEDIAGLVLFLASDESRYVNGQLILIDGGQKSHHTRYEVPG
jgi:NAD(P)-dependent dehydrogenase (short-subunit alcohol dehydrogenase family)